MSLFLIYQILCGLFTMFIFMTGCAYINYLDYADGHFNSEDYWKKALGATSITLVIGLLISYVSWLIIPILFGLLLTATILLLTVYSLVLLFNKINLNDITKRITEKYNALRKQ